MKITKLQIDARTSTMEKTIKGLGIDVGDIVKVGSAILVCNENYELVGFLDGKYSSNYPNLILGMVSGENEYVVFKVAEKVIYSQCNSEDLN